LDVDIGDRFAHAVKFALDGSRTVRVVEPSVATEVGRLPGVRPSRVRRVFLAAVGFAVTTAAVAFGPQAWRSKATRKTGAKGRRAAPPDVCSYLDRGSQVSGKLNFEGPAQIDGRIDGEIVAKDSILIGESAAVTARIRAASIIVAGEVKGEISASQCIELRPPAKVLGKLTAPKLIVHEGARRFDLEAAASDKLIAKPLSAGKMENG
jgi:cytoskeletal protein CcmA (bactofilin family)